MKFNLSTYKIITTAVNFSRTGPNLHGQPAFASPGTSKSHGVRHLWHRCLRLRIQFDTNCDDFDVKQVRIANGISKDAFITRGHLPQKMEIFQLRINRGLSAVKYFTGLTELVVLCQRTVTNLRGIEACPNLVTLWINQCELKQIDDSIKYLSRLRSLHICSNRIKSIQNLDRLKKDLFNFRFQKTYH